MANEMDYDMDGDSNSSDYDLDNASQSSSEDPTPEEIQEAQQLDAEKQAEVQTCLKSLEASLSTGQLAPIGNIVGGRFDLYSAEYVAHYYYEGHANKYIRFGNYFQNSSGPRGSTCNANQINGEIHVFPEGHFNFFPFNIPSGASLTPTTLKSWEGQELQILFLGNGMVKIRAVLDDFLEEGKKTHPGKTIELSGIWVSDEERKRRSEEWWGGQVEVKHENYR